MTRSEKKRLEKEKTKIEKLIDEFLKGYMKSITDLRDDTKHSLTINDNKLQVDENHKYEISKINVTYLKVWRGVVDHVRKEFKMATIDPNYFDNYMVWN